MCEYKYRLNDPPNLHIRSTKEVIGFHILSYIGEIGHAEDFQFDSEICAYNTCSWILQLMVRQKSDHFTSPDQGNRPGRTSICR